MWTPKKDRPPLRDGNDFLSADVLGCFSNGRMMVLNYDVDKGWVDAEEGIQIVEERLISWTHLPNLHEAEQRQKEEKNEKT